jgi:hypothetical protein
MDRRTVLSVLSLANYPPPFCWESYCSYLRVLAAQITTLRTTA